MVRAVNPLVRASALTGRSVVTSSGSSSTEVQDLVLGEDGNAVVGLTVREPGVFGKRHVGVIPMSAVASIGPDAVVTNGDDDALEAETGDPKVAASVLGSTVVTHAGVRVGKVTDVVVEISRNHVRSVAIEVDADAGTRYLVLEAGMDLTKDVLVVPERSEVHLCTTPDEVAEHLGAR